MIALDTVYHKSCFRNYTRNNCVRIVQQEKSTVEQATKDRKSHAAFEELAANVELRLIKGGQVIRLNTLCAEYVQLLEKRGMTCNHIRGDLLKRKLQRNFGKNLTFVSHIVGRIQCWSTLALMMP